MFDYFFKQVGDSSRGWIDCYNDPDRKVRYKFEDGLTLVSCLCECTVQAPILNILALFCEVDLFKDWFPNIKSVDVVKELTPYRGLYSCKQTMPWPLWPREMVFSATGMFDVESQSCLTVMKTVHEGSTFFGTDVPALSTGYVKLDIKRGYHFFQRIDDNTTRYVTIFNTDP